MGGSEFQVRDIAKMQEWVWCVFLKPQESQSGRSRVKEGDRKLGQRDHKGQTESVLAKQ